MDCNDSHRGVDLVDLAGKCSATSTYHVIMDSRSLILDDGKTKMESPLFKDVFSAIVFPNSSILLSH